MVFWFVLGLCVGSFINCLVYRLNTQNRGNLGGRSFCDHCKHKLAWRDNIPLLSFILLKGKCRYCHSPISWQYPLVELGTGVVFSIWYRVYGIGGIGGIGEILFFLFISSTLIVIFVSDLKYQIIPDQIVYPAIIISFFFSLLTSHFSLRPVLTSIGAGLGFLFLHFLTRGKGMGLGDVKLAALMGLLLGWPKIIVALYFAFLTGAIFGVILILLGKKRFGEHIPFGPFLTAGTFIALFWGEKIWQQASAALL